MPGDNCSIFGCPVSRSSKYKGIGIYKVPSGDSDFEKTWREKLIAIIVRDRVVDATLKERIAKKKLFICQKHYRPDQILSHDTRTSVKPGEIPDQNLPIKTFVSPPSTPRQSSLSIKSKRTLYGNEQKQSSSTLTSPPSYKSFDEFKKRVSSLKLPAGWNLSFSPSIVTALFMDGVHLVPKFEIYIFDNLTFSVRVYLWNLPSTSIIYRENSQSFQFTTLSNFIALLTSHDICPGINLDNAIKYSFIHHNVPKIYLPSPSNIDILQLHQTEFFRAESCQFLLPPLTPSSTPCLSCSSLLKKETSSFKRKADNLLVPAKPNAPIKFTAPDKVKLTLQNYRIENKLLKSDLERMKELIVENNIKITDDLNNDLKSIISNADIDKMPPFMKFFWEEQQKYLQASETGIRYHPALIRFCLSLASKSASAYDELRYDKKTNTGFLILPSRRRLRDYKNYIHPQRGFNPGVIEELKIMTKDFSDPERYVTILIDEMKVQEDLVWDKHSGELIGYVDLGDKEINEATLKDSELIASHILVFLVRGAVNPLKYSFANFATKNVSSLQIFPIFWKAVGILEDSNLKVIAVTSDGASSNRSFYKMHSKMFGSVVTQDGSVFYKAVNFFAEEDRFIHFICDQPHALKTGRNNLSHSAFGQSSRLLWNDGNYIIWGHISQLVNEDLECGLKLCSKVSMEHINLTPFSRMNVRLAAQVLSESMSVALLNFGPPDAKGTADYCLMFDKFFDCMNVRNSVEHKHKRKPFLAPYTSVDDERFSWLLDEFLPYFSKWKKSIEDRPGKFTPADKLRMFISWQTHEALNITTSSIIDIIKYLLNHNVQYVFTERFCQDPLENYFGRQRSMGHRSDNPSIRQFGYNDNTIRRTKTFKPIQSGNSRDTSDTFSISSDPLPSRRRPKSSSTSVHLPTSSHHQPSP